MKLAASLALVLTLPACRSAPPPPQASPDAAAAALAPVADSAPAPPARGLDAERLARELAAIDSDGCLGVCVQAPGAAPVCLRADERFSLQSVMKLVVAAVVLDEVDKGRLALDEKIRVRWQDRSLGVQPIEKEITRTRPFETTVDDLLVRAVTESDSLATDVLYARVGGAPAIAAFLAAHGLARGLRIDRDERHLQAETAGLTWRDEYVDPAAYERARQRLGEDARDAAQAAYLRDERDTASPRGMTDFLRQLADGKLLPPAATEHLLEVMERTKTFPDRLKAGLGEGWELGHKTGSSGTWRGVTAATNDVGLVTAPDGTTIAVSVFLAESRREPAARNAVVAEVARAVVRSYRGQ